MVGLIKKQQNNRKGEVQRKIIMLLSAGLALGLTRNPNQYFRVIREVGREWQNIERDSLNRAINSLYKSKLIKTKDNRDGTVTLMLAKEGRQLALSYNINEMKIRTPSRWDGKWRIVMFDVPEKFKKTREALRMHFKNMEFYEFQKSVFVHPHPCTEEIEYIMEFYKARKFIRFVVSSEIDNAIELKRHFGL